MALGKQAKILTEAQQKVVLSYLAGRRLAQRNTVMFLLSVDAGLRAKEIAALEWAMVTDAQPAYRGLILTLWQTWALRHRLRNSVTKFFRQVSQRHSPKTPANSAP